MCQKCAKHYLNHSTQIFQRLKAVNKFTHLPPSAAYLLQWTESSLLQVMACCLLGTKPLPEPMLAYCQLDSWEQMSIKLKLEFYHFHSRKLESYHFHSRKCIWMCWLQNGGHVVQGEMSLVLQGPVYWDTQALLQWIQEAFSLWPVASTDNYISPKIVLKILWGSIQYENNKYCCQLGSLNPIVNTKSHRSICQCGSLFGWA